MSALPEPLRRLAEDLNSNSPLRPDEERVATDRYVVCFGAGGGPYQTVVQQLRLRPDEVEGAVAEVRARVRARGRRAATWEVGPSATPADLAARLLQLGMAPDEEPLAVGMVLTTPPPPPPPGIEVRAVRTREEFFTSCAILHRCFGVLANDEAARRAEVGRQYEVHRAHGIETRYLAYLDGRPVATGLTVHAAAGTVLCGGATLPEARGRGAYRALVHARWHDSGGQPLVVQAGAMSRPILRGLGFVEVAEIRIFRDVLGDLAEG